MSDGVELFGAIGVMEGHQSTLLRDAQVMPIWEGTTNTLSLDLVRLVAKEPHSLDAVHKQLLDDLLRGGDAETASKSRSINNNNNDDKDVQQVVALANQTFAQIRAFASDPAALETNSRRLSMQLARLWVTALERARRATRATMRSSCSSGTGPPAAFASRRPLWTPPCSTRTGPRCRPR